ncbi:uncharacterized protein LOC113363767 isoform X1 [Ctenocephalides felis]|uniref:uncharacterized protein LOC113363767 isoform X1 n=1 Tax=Ctenocephalides felis TaxID=7515 RepID=UPI000E6E50A0|nr:uncharacterized protein LOC113363767 isoform X1 [Ctenocephalides felis]
MDPGKALNFQTFPHQNGHTPVHQEGNRPQHAHSRAGSQSMPRQNNRYARKNSQGGNSNIYTPGPDYDDPANCAEEDQYRSRYTRVNSLGGSLYGGAAEYDDPANCAEEDQYGSQYQPYGAPCDHYGSRKSIVSRNPNAQNNGGVTTVGNGSPEPPPPPPPPRNHDQQGNGSFNDSKESNEISEAECDRDQLPRNYAVRAPHHKDPRSTEEMRKLIDRNEAEPRLQTANAGQLTAHHTMAV